MNYADYKKFDMLNGKGIRHSLFVSGCHFRCKGCWNAVAWNPNFGKPYTKDLEDKIVEDCCDTKIDGLSLLGGEPFDHAGDLLSLVHRVEDKGRSIWAWTGNTFEELMENGSEEQKLLLLSIDVLVDGQFMIDKKDLSLPFRGSSNQRILNAPVSIFKQKAVLYQL
jgi:anaerobic ribonucleoside-triphosphate reductase activating protein